MNRSSCRAALALGALVLAEGDVMAREDFETDANNKAAVERAFAAWSAGAGSPFDLLADDASWTIAGRSLVSGTYADRASFLREVIAPFNARMRSGLKPTVREVVSAAGRVVVRFDGHALARDGVPYDNSYAWFMQFRGGRVVAVTAFFDSLAFDELWRRVPPS